MEVDIHFIKENLEWKQIDVQFVNSSEWLAYVLTHDMSKCVFDDSFVKLSIGDIYAST